LKTAFKIHFFSGIGKHTVILVKVFRVPKGQFREAFEHLNNCIA